MLPDRLRRCRPRVRCVRRCLGSARHTLDDEALVLEAYENRVVDPQLPERLFVAAVDRGAVTGVEVRMITSANGVQQFALPPANPKKPIRFGVGRPGRRSSVWRQWANKNKDDVYLATRHGAGVFKISLHESGDWRLQWVDRNVLPDPRDATFIPLSDSATEGRVLDQWSRPSSGGTGWTDALSLWVPSEDVREIPCDAEPGRDAQWIDAPAPGNATEFRVVFVEPAGDRLFDLTAALEEPNSSLALVNGFRLASGTAVLLLASTRRLHDSFQDELAKARDEAAANVPTEFHLAAQTGPRTLWINADHNGRRNFWDLAFPTA